MKTKPRGKACAAAQQGPRTGGRPSPWAPLARWPVDKPWQEPCGLTTVSRLRRAHTPILIERPPTKTNPATIPVQFRAHSPHQGSTYLSGKSVQTNRATSLGGWLTVVAFASLVSGYRLVVTLVDGWPAYTVGSWRNLTTATSDAYHPLWESYLLFSLVGNIFLLVGLGLISLLFVKRRSSLPRIYIVFMVTGLAISVLDIVLSLFIPAAAQATTKKEWIELAKYAVGVAIWTAYFLRSQRVRATFIERSSKLSATTPPPSAADPTTA